MTAVALRPPVPYYGGKQTVARRIAALLPAHDHYIEPFAGSLAVLFAKVPARIETVNDLDDELVTFWRVLRDRHLELEVVCALTPHARTEHQLAFQPADLDLEVARRVWVRLTQGRTARLTPTGWRNLLAGAGGSATMATYQNGYRKRLPSTAERVRSLQVECRPALEVIASYGSKPTSLLYVDPPYPAETGRGLNYRHEMPSREQHQALAEALHGCRAAVVLSGYACDLYDLDLYPDWHRYEIASGTSQGGARQARTEVLWSNRELAPLNTGSNPSGGDA